MNATRSTGRHPTKFSHTHARQIRLGATTVTGGTLGPASARAREPSARPSRARETGARYLREFIEDAKATGFVVRALEKSGVGGVSVAPAAPLQE